jgi:hypothetical protein
MIELRVQPGLAAARGLAQVKALAWTHEGEHELRILVGERRLNLGPMWRYDASRECVAALEEFGAVTVIEQDFPHGR